MSLNSKNIKIAKAGFEYKCLFVLVDGFRLMKAANKYAIDWEEEQITAQLIDFIELSQSRNKWKIHIKPEIRMYNLEIIKGRIVPKKAPKIDMQMLSWQTEAENVYHIEAKNLCESDWTKGSGASVSSSYQLNRYINSGISNFFSGFYPSNGCVCGYILKGTIDNIISKLNTILANKSLNQLQVSRRINGHSMIYKIRYDDNELINIFFYYQQ